jgi:hypothetical protein
MLAQARLSEFDENIVNFDGGQEKWKGWDQYLARCRGGGVHLHLYKLSGYKGCEGCRFIRQCANNAHCYGEQAEP